MVQSLNQPEFGEDDALERSLLDGIGGARPLVGPARLSGCVPLSTFQSARSASLGDK